MGLDSIVKTLAAAVLAAGLSIGNASAEETPPKVEIRVNQETEERPKGATYETTYAAFIPGMEILERGQNIPNLSSAEETEVRNILMDIKNSNINSYQELVQRANTLSEDQNLVLLTAIGGLLHDFGYTRSDTSLLSQNTFFNRMQNSMITLNYNSIGDCGNIHSNVERLANDLGIQAAAVTGSSASGDGHVYSILRTENSCAVIDYSQILMIDSNNVENALEAYQKHNGTTAFDHWFFEDGEFKYRLITEDGRNFLDFVEYDGSLEPLRSMLVTSFDESADSIITINQGDYSNSYEFNHQGFFVKAGNITGSDSSPMENTDLVQFGYKRRISDKYMDLAVNTSLVYGEIDQDAEREIVRGFNLEAIYSALCYGGSKITYRTSLNKFKTDDDELYTDYMLGIGASYKLDYITPYAAIQIAHFPEAVDDYEPGIYFNELAVGTLLGKKGISIEPYYALRKWEQEFGANAKLGNKHFGLSAGIYTTESDYELAPDREGISAGLYINKKNVGVNILYKREEIDYGGDPEETESVNAGVFIKF